MADIRLRSSMKAHSKGNVVLLVVNFRTLGCIEYSGLMFIPAKKRIIESAASKNSLLMSRASPSS